MERFARALGDGDAVHAPRIPRRTPRLGECDTRNRLDSVLPRRLRRCPRRRRTDSRLPALFQGPLVRRIRLRLGMARSLSTPRPGLLPEAHLRCPVTPVPGARLLVRDASLRAVLLAAIENLARETSTSSIHLLFLDAARQRRARRRLDAAQHGAISLDQSRPRALCGLRRFPRWPATREAQEDQAGATQGGRRRRPIREPHRPEISTGDWDFFYRCYTLTYHAHRSTPYLTRDPLLRPHRRHTARKLAALHRVARRPSHRGIADRIDPGRRHAFRSATGAPPRRSTACTSRPATTSRSPGALPKAIGASRAARRARTRWRAVCCRRHRVRPLARAAAVCEAVAEFLQREGEAVAGYLDELDEHGPFKSKPLTDDATRK